jgi:formate transporter
MSPDAPIPLAMDPYTPVEMAHRVEAGGVAKSALPLGPAFVLAVLAGAFVGLGALLSTIAGTDTGLGYGPTRLLAGAAFSLGLVLVVVGGAELFTGNALLVMAWAEGKVGTQAVLRNWLVAYLGNFVGALATAYGVYRSGVMGLGSGRVAATAVALAQAKAALGWEQAFLRGVFCNALVCLAVWLGFSARTTTDRILCIVFPITAFVAAGFEHSIANFYFLPLGHWLGGGAGTAFGDCLRNLLAVTLGNLVGGALLVGACYWFIYLRKR